MNVAQWCRPLSVSGRRFPIIQFPVTPHNGCRRLHHCTMICYDDRHCRHRLWPHLNVQLMQVATRGSNKNFQPNFSGAEQS